MPQFDEFEIKMLDVLQRDGRKPVSELAQEIGLSTTPCGEPLELHPQLGHDRALDDVPEDVLLDGLVQQVRTLDGRDDAAFHLRLVLVVLGVALG